MNLTDHILNNKDAGRITVLVNLEYSRLFDSVNHKALLAILPSMVLCVLAVSFLKIIFFLGHTELR